LLVANTGLDMVVRCTAEGDLLQVWNVLQQPPWERFSPCADYRKVETTKPHKSHPNFVFELNGQLWVTRFRQRDAICLDDPAKRIEIAVQRPHDGILYEGKIYFTTVDGKIVIANADTLQVETIVDLQKMEDGNALLGWCRGLLVVDTKKIWVGFSRIRKTQFQENVLWLRNVIREGMTEKPTHIALYDLARGGCVQEYELEQYGMNIVFSIFPAD